MQKPRNICEMQELRNPKPPKQMLRNVKPKKAKAKKYI